MTHNILTSCHLLPTFLSGIPSECQTVWNQIRPDILSGLILVQTICKGYHHMPLVDKESKGFFCADI